MAFAKGTFTQWLNHLNGIQMSKYEMVKFPDADGKTFHNPRRGIFIFRHPDLQGMGEGLEIDLNGLVPDSTLTQDFTRVKAYLYGWYNVRAAQNEFVPGPFVDAWADDDDEV